MGETSKMKITETKVAAHHTWGTDVAGKDIRLVSTGFGNFFRAARTIAVISAESKAAKEYMKEAKEKGLLLPTTEGRKCMSLIVLDTGCNSKRSFSTFIVKISSPAFTS